MDSKVFAFGLFLLNCNGSFGTLKMFQSEVEEAAVPKKKKTTKDSPSEFVSALFFVVAYLSGGPRESQNS